MDLRVTTAGSASARPLNIDCTPGWLRRHRRMDSDPVTKLVPFIVNGAARAATDFILERYSCR